MITKKLASSPMLYMSSGSKELFHRNFLYWLGTNYRDKFQILMTRLLSIASQWPDEWILHREFLHLDLCVTYKKEKEKKNSKGKKSTEECVFIIIENKVNRSAEPSPILPDGLSGAVSLVLSPRFLREYGSSEENFTFFQ